MHLAGPAAPVVALTLALGVVLPASILAVWLAVGALIAWASGWSRLAAAYPDRDDPAVVRFALQSAALGRGIHVNHALTVTACGEGLRLSIPPVFTPFCRPVFIPWREIAVTRRDGFLGRKRVALAFGSPAVGGIEISAALAERVAHAVPQAWPERHWATRPRPAELREDLTPLVVEWIIATGVGAALLTVAPALATHGRVVIGPVLAIGAPAIVFGALVLVSWRNRR